MPVMIVNLFGDNDNWCLECLQFKLEIEETYIRR